MLRLRTGYKIVDARNAIYVWDMIHEVMEAFYVPLCGNVYVANGSRKIVTGASHEQWQQWTHSVFTENGWQSPWEEV